MKNIPGYLSLILLVVALWGCAEKATDKSSKKPLRFIDAIEFPTNATQDSVQIGGLSSAEYDPVTSELIAVSDDTGLRGGPRIHHFNVTLDSNSLQIASTGITLLKDSDGENIYPERIIDSEGLLRLRNGNFLVSSEGIDYKGYFSRPALLEFGQNGHLLKNWHIPEKFQPRGNKMVEFGVRNNNSFESLAVTPDNKTIYMAIEKPLFQDDEAPDLHNDRVIRFIKYKQQDDAYQYAAEYVYFMEKMAMQNGDPDTSGETSVSDMLAINDKNFLVVEKAYFTKPVRKNSVQIYLAILNDDTTDVSEFESLKTAEHISMSKRLWVNLDEFESLPDFPGLDNVEGITFGPTLDNGNRTLILLSDNNFTDKQKTLVYAFEILDTDF